MLYIYVYIYEIRHRGTQKFELHSVCIFSNLLIYIYEYEPPPVYVYIFLMTKYLWHPGYYIDMCHIEQYIYTYIYAYIYIHMQRRARMSRRRGAIRH